jgi:hypothetical protein
MLSTPLKTALLLLALGGAAHAQTRELWSTIDNQTGSTVDFQIADDVVTVGSIYLAAPDSSSYVELHKASSLNPFSRTTLKGTLQPGKNRIYFNTNSAGLFAGWFQIGNSLFNVGFGKVVKVFKNVCVQEKPGLNPFRIRMEDEGLNNAAGPAWLTLVPKS